jgi:hypothetical protein
MPTSITEWFTCVEQSLKIPLLEECHLEASTRTPIGITCNAVSRSLHPFTDVYPEILKLPPIFLQGKFNPIHGYSD